MYNIILVIHIYRYWERKAERKYTMLETVIYQTSLGYLATQLNHISQTS